MAPDDTNDDVSIDPVTISDREPVSAKLKSPTKLNSTTPVTQKLKGESTVNWCKICLTGLLLYPMQGKM